MIAGKNLEDITEKDIQEYLETRKQHKEVNHRVDDRDLFDILLDSVDKMRDRTLDVKNKDYIKKN